MQNSNEEYDFYIQKIKAMDEDILLIKENISIITDSLRETQKYLVKLAANQAELSRRLATWPFLTVNKKD